MNNISSTLQFDVTISVNLRIDYAFVAALVRLIRLRLAMLGQNSIHDPPGQAESCPA
jgi:hypothetical protein